MGKTRRNILTGRRPRLMKGKRQSMMRAGTSSIKASKGKSTGLGLSKENIYDGIVPAFLHMLNTVKLYHWKTTSFSTHKATDELYGGLNDKLDEFVEVMLGKNGMNRERILNVKSVNLSSYSSNDMFKKQIEDYINALLNLSNDTAFNTLANTDLLAIRDEIVALLNKFLYLLTLK